MLDPTAGQSKNWARMQGVAETLRRYRKSRGLSQRHLADLMGVHENTVANLEKHPERTLLETIEKAADALGINTGELFYEATLQCGKPSNPRCLIQIRRN